MAKAKGEMLYALNFINLFKSTEAELEPKEFIFSNAYTSIEVLSKRIETKHSSRFNTIMVWFTIGIFLLTVFIMILTYKIYKTSSNQINAK